ncbi:F-box domain containing protein [Melia azedarach]|uniref:F-box domain containing protein n=1 Tax=Melia azedarach TaxID=155640 RepID=A0ACC1Y2T8_MELAZ|nr:F-box domain containing protein [Melia azedarach]
MVDGSFDIIKKRRIDDVDRISALPESILQHIMSFLPFRDVVRTSVLSKTWEKAWHTFPDIEFDEKLFGQDLRNLLLLGFNELDRGHKRFDQMKRKLLNYWEKVLQSRRWEMTSLRKFTLKTERLSDLEFVHQCIRYAVENNVKVLKLEISLEKDVFYNLPQMVLCLKSITVLKLRGFKLESPGSNVKLSSLRELYLSDVNADVHVVENLVGGCPLIEFLSIEFCGGFKSLKLSGLSKLSIIKVQSNSELEWMTINAPNARSMAVIGPDILSDINIATCKNLKFLGLCTASVVDGWLSNQIPGLPLLEGLNIGLCYELKSIKISSSSLKTLVISSCMNLVEVKFETPNLTKFGYEGEIISFSSGVLSLLETDFYIYSSNIDNEWYVKFVELITKFHGFSKVLNLQSDSGQIAIVPSALRQILPPPLSGVKHLNFAITMPFKSFPIAQVLDGLLWMSPHVQTVSIKLGQYFKTFRFQFSYKEHLLCGEEIKLPVSCWKDCIKKVEIEFISEKMEVIETFNNVDMRTEADSKWYAFEDELLLEKIDKLVSQSQ